MTFVTQHRPIRRCCAYSIVFAFPISHLTHFHSNSSAWTWATSWYFWVSGGWMTRLWVAKSWEAPAPVVESAGIFVAAAREHSLKMKHSNKQLALLKCEKKRLTTCLENVGWIVMPKLVQVRIVDVCLFTYCSEMLSGRRSFPSFIYFLFLQSALMYAFHSSFYFFSYFRELFFHIQFWLYTNGRSLFLFWSAYAQAIFARKSPQSHVCVLNSNECSTFLELYLSWKYLPVVFSTAVWLFWGTEGVTCSDSYVKRH